jgi:glycerol-3-phosphate acyltransferase PlsX
VAEPLSKLKRVSPLLSIDMPRVAVDAMGGDRAPGVVVEGALLAARELTADIILVGQKDAVEHELARHATDFPTLPIMPASQVIPMDESPSMGLRKKDSSIKVAFEMMKRGEAEAVVSAGNSGAMMAAGMFVMGTLFPVTRPAISIVVPSRGKGTVIIDAGANVDCRPAHLLQFAIMGSVYAEQVLSVSKPRVGLLSNGEEESKGNELTRAARDLIAAAALNYIGYVEGRDIFDGRVDVVVCDGFTGNVVLKTMEGVAGFVGEILKSAFNKSLPSRLGYLMSRKSLREAYGRIDYAEYGGAPLLGLDGVAIIAHGGSTPRAIKNAIRVAAESVSHDVNRHISEALQAAGVGAAEKPDRFPRSIWRRIKSKIENLSERSPVEVEGKGQKGGR